ncbi:hypothetical protein [Bacillus sp. RO1]|uniref:hypothetical protein n=1 Tax=Bacillus sp. RO1 TaxID=2722703 RepID=UPI0014571AEC|nr:hypothetical protein [Bacillus sp. RO1]NLP52058.1 hypothetical protein [Bacillus sp. RO1]
MKLTAENQAEEIVELLTTSTQIPNQYFEYGSLFILNVSSSEDAIQEYALYKKDEETACYYKFESITVTWYEKEKLLSYLIESDLQDINSMTAAASDTCLKASNRPYLDDIMSFEKMGRFKKAFERFKEVY